MVVYKFKSIQIVPEAKDLVDIILSKTNRTTATVVRKGWEISRIRRFYTMKVKTVQQHFHNRLSQVLTDFPILDELHPFYADLINVLYDRDHYKLALGQLSTCRHLIDNIAQDHVRYLKYGQSLFQCKNLKRAALGRMCTLIKRQSTSLAYLEQVRQHLSRLPSIDPTTRTLILCGYPNVGKSSFINKMTRANSEVQPYAFTTKSLFVGHMDYKYVKWQLIDTPGILDHPLEDRNTIEMQSITALAHLRAAVLYLVDISEECGYSVETQLNLFDSIKPLFSKKPVIMAMNKIDVASPSDLPEDARNRIEKLARTENVTVLPMSTLSEQGVIEVRNTACEKLLAQRVEVKLKTKGVGDVLNRLHVAQPKPRDHKAREASIPESVIAARQSMEVVDHSSNTGKKKTKPQVDSDEELIWYKDEPSDEDEEEKNPTNFGVDWRKDYILKNEDWKFDPIPEIMDGKNIADFIDPDILAMLDRLEADEEQRLAAADLAENDDNEELDEETIALAEAVKEHKAKMILRSQAKKSIKAPPLPRTRADPNGIRTRSGLESHLSDMGIDASKALKNVRSRSRSRSRGRSVIDESTEMAKKRKRSLSRSREQSVDSSRGIPNVASKRRAVQLERNAQKPRNREARQGEGDRHIGTKMPKHLFAGKRGGGKTERR